MPRGLLPLLRVCLWFVVSGLLGVSMLGHALGQELDRAALRGGRALWALSFTHRSNAPQRLTLNGTTLFVQTATLNASLERVLGDAHRSCGDRGVTLPKILARLVGEDGVFARRSDRDGTVACVQVPGAYDEAYDGAYNAGELAERLRRLAATGDLGALGSFHYLYARRESHGRTAVLSLWSEGSFDIGAMFPPAGDAPGEDVPGLPRPQGSVRVLSVLHDALSQPMVVYRAPRRVQAVEADYVDELRHAGLLVEAASRAPERGSRRQGERLWIVESAEHTRFVAFIEERGTTWVVSTPLP